VKPLRLLPALWVGVALHAQPAGSAPPASAVPAAPAAAKLFAIQFTTGPAWNSPPEVKDPLFRQHSDNLQRMRREGIVQFGARYGDKGLVVVHAADEAAVRAQVAQDPSVTAGLFQAEVHEFRPFFHGSTARLATPEAIALRAYYDAFNRHDAEAVAAACAEDLQWFSVEGDKVGTDASNRAQLLTWLKGYFASLPTVRSDVLAVEQAGAFLTVRERASWENKSGQRVAQQAIGVYEIRAGLIRRVWYFPSAKDPSPTR
jgi:uncharacterized protein YciI/ketosteroid isomerase-like protein